MTAALDTLQLFVATRGIDSEPVAPLEELEPFGVDSLVLIEAACQSEVGPDTRVPKLGTLRWTEALTAGQGAALTAGVPLPWEAMRAIAPLETEAGRADRLFLAGRSGRDLGEGATALSTCVALGGSNTLLALRRVDRPLAR
jgi:hypothetical protein